MNLGIGFSQSISKTPRKLASFDKKGDDDSFGPKQFLRRNIIFAAFLLVFILLLFQTIRLQLISGPYYRVLADQNRTKTKIIHAPRGTIFDRNGEALVHNIPGFREKILDCKEEESKNGCVRIVRREEVLARKSRGEDLSGLEVDTLRQYVKPEITAHVLGFVSQISKEELSSAEYNSKGYIGGDQIGRGGVEEQYESVLAGVSGKELIETDATGKEVRVLGKEDPRPGSDITLALDTKLQEVAFAGMAGKTGAVIVSDPATGEILALVSTPSFDANLFTLGDSYASEEASTSAYHSVHDVLSDEKNRPLFDRAISGTYPPGSTFKIITASAALESGAIKSDTEIEDTGIIHIGAFSFSNWYFTQYGGKEGFVNIVSALKRSNDIFFYKAAEATGLEKIHEMGLRFGLDERLGIDLPQEATGLFPTDAWKRETIGEQWYIGDTYHLGIGQGYLLVTPLQTNSWTNVIANDGTLCQPKVEKSGTCKVKNKGFLQEETINLIKEGMKAACKSGGTGWPLFNFKVKNEKLKIDDMNYFTPDEATVSGEANGVVHIPVACKTGTAEFGDPKNRTHAWFTSYAPIADPQISVSVLVESGGEGSSVAAPIAKKIYEEWFSR